MSLRGLRWGRWRLAHRLAQSAQIDRAVFYVLAGRVWSFASGPITLVLIASQLTPQVQGYYYTFASLVALQGFAELGLGIVIVQFASHEWAFLSLDRGRVVG